MSELTLGCFRSSWTHGEVEGRFRGCRIAFLCVQMTIYVFLDRPTGIKTASYPYPGTPAPSVEFLADLAARTAGD